jgi:hypothetical protein
LPHFRVDEAGRLEPEPFGELAAAVVRHRGNLEDRQGDREACAGRQVVGAEVEIDVEVVAGERPAGLVLRDQRDRAGIHQRDLDVRMRAAVG